jgi:hypothetical protein
MTACISNQEHIKENSSAKMVLDTKKILDNPLINEELKKGYRIWLDAAWDSMPTAQTGVKISTKADQSNISLEPSDLEAADTLTLFKVQGIKEGNNQRNVLADSFVDNVEAQQVPKTLSKSEIRIETDRVSLKRLRKNYSDVDLGVSKKTKF